MITRYSPDRLNARLDEIQQRLPRVPATIFGLQRKISERVVHQLGQAVDSVQAAAGRTSSTGRTAVRTVIGTARWAGERTAAEAATGTRRVVGQSKAQARIAAGAVADEVTRQADGAREALSNARDTTAEAVDAAAAVIADKRPGSGTPYEEWTKDALYQRAQELDIEGRSAMSKTQLIDALRDAA